MPNENCRHRYTYFDRTLCADGNMHTCCAACFKVVDGLDACE